MDKIENWFEEASINKSTDVVSLYNKLSPIDLVSARYRFNILKKLMSSKRVSTSRISKKSWQGKKSRLTGLCFEWFIKSLFNDSEIVVYLHSVNTSANEIDFLFQPLPEARLVPFLNKLAPTHFLGEAKCYTTKNLSVKWIDSLVGVMKTNTTNVAILFIFKKGKIQTPIKYKLKILESSDKTVIIPIGLTQIERILNGEHVFTVLNDQYVKVVSTYRHLTL